MSEEKRVEIISLSYRLVHAHNLHLWSFLAVSGAVMLAIQYFSWLAYAVGYPAAVLLRLDPAVDAVTLGVQILRILHRILGVLWGIMIIVYGIYLVGFRKLEVLRPLRKPLKEQVAEVKALAGRYILGKPLPKEVEEKLDRHNVFVAYLALLLAVAFALLAFSGASMVFLPLTIEQYRLMLLLHDIGFYLSLLFVYLHLFASLHPANAPILRAMFRDGTVTLEEAKQHMPQWLKRKIK
ncbi:cytochrome b/b6 domain-containing protein [Infirmifilum lucidum]|uniref:Cytochrome b/b6 domain-containing protein n=1 Tax=Infirmifilum lucidum TaxID=2776706 RepID=A0A7L9FH15_9CREN|nr:cytochrome b/b6 domain-containing protein [Infirmifilum lucidum]QOJ78921.1 cytochrome b/b6 domain-containing protein [Infirmifilum lucidum]